MENEIPKFRTGAGTEATSGTEEEESCETNGERRAAARHFEGFDFEGLSFVCAAAASSAMLFNAAQLKEAFLSFFAPLPSPRRETPSLKATSRQLSDRALPRERLYLRLSLTEPGVRVVVGEKAQRGVWTASPFLCLHRTTLEESELRLYGAVLALLLSNKWIITE